MEGQMHTGYSNPQQNATCEVSVNLKVEPFLSLWTIRKALSKATDERIRADTVASTMPDDQT